jgi:hypothetical protein
MERNVQLNRVLGRKYLRFLTERIQDAMSSFEESQKLYSDNDKQIDACEDRLNMWCVMYALVDKEYQSLKNLDSGQEETVIRARISVPDRE